MIKNYLKIAWRNLVRNKIYSLVNILGLAIGMAACFFVLQYVYFESGYDRFHTNASDIYRVPISMLSVPSDGDGGGQPDGHLATNHPALGMAMKRDFPEVIDYVRMVNFSQFANKYAVSYDQPGGERRVFNETGIFLTDSSFFNVFSFPLVKGSREHCLAAPNTIVISESVARKYFGNSDPINQVLTVNGFAVYFNRNVFPLKVTGVFRDVPENSHIKFDMLISYASFPYSWLNDNWAWPEFYNYVLLAPGTDAKKLEAKLPGFVEKYLGTSMKQFNFRVIFHLQPIADIHLKSRYSMEAEVNGSEREVYFLSVIGVFILIIAWINYINISTAKSMERAKEVGVRKVAGAIKPQLIGQFLLESFIINLLALFISLVIIAECMPLFDRFVGKNISADFFSRGLGGQPMFWVAAVALFIGGSFLVGAYPALVLSSFKPVRVLKGLIIRSNTGISLRRVLVSFQFFLSIILIGATLIVFSQLRFMRNSDLGYTKDQVMIIKAPPVMDSTSLARYSFFKSEVLKMPFVHNAAPTSDIPGKMIRFQNHVWPAVKDKQSGVITYMMEIDPDFLDTYKMRLLAGRNFLASDSSNIFMPSRRHNVLINEETSRLLGFRSPEDAVNKEITFVFGVGEVPARVLGVVKNYHQRSFKEQYDPILYYFPVWADWKYISLSLDTDHLSDHLAAVERVYRAAFPNNPFEHFFQDDFFYRQYQADQRLGGVFALFTLLAILVACLGLLGLSSFVIRLRTKEIGIRKVLGASVSGILGLISKDFAKLVFLAAVIAVPLVYWAADKWLNNYAFHIKLTWYTLIIPPLVLLLVVLLTVCLQSLKAALTNPVKSLRTE